MLQIYYMLFFILSCIHAIENNVGLSIFVGEIGGNDLSRRALVQAMVRSKEEWQAVASFCDNCMQVIPERANVVYMNPKYLYQNGTVNVRRYSRKSLYYINVLGTNKHTWTNNITVTVGVSQFLHNEYRPSFVEMSQKLCDLVNKEPFVGGALRNAGVSCPFPPGYHQIANITAPTENFPSVFPFEKGRIEVTLSITDTKESVLQVTVVASFKQKL